MTQDTPAASSAPQEKARLLAERVLELNVVTEPGLRAKEAARAVLDETIESPAELALRSLACWLGVGGYNSLTIDAKVMERRIREGVDQLVASFPGEDAQAATSAAGGATGDAAQAWTDGFEAHRKWVGDLEAFWWNHATDEPGAPAMPVNPYRAALAAQSPAVPSTLDADLARFGASVDDGSLFNNVPAEMRTLLDRVVAAQSPDSGAGPGEPTIYLRADGPHEEAKGTACPVTGRPYFMHLTHPELGQVPTYGGPYDSYTAPYAEGDPLDPWHERELTVHRYDHDRGHWVEDEGIPLRIIHEEVLFKLEEDATPSPPVAAVPATPDITTLEAAMRAIEQALSLIGEPQDERMRTVRRVLRGAVVIAEDAAAQPQTPAAPLTHVHRKSGGLYALLGEGRLQSDTPLGDMSEIAIYQGEDGRLWARDATEFGGRFDPITTHKDAP